LAVKSASFVIFYDWETGVLVRKVDVAATNIFWSALDTVCISTSTSFFVLKFNRPAFQESLDASSYNYEEGAESSLTFICEVPEM